MVVNIADFQMDIWFSLSVRFGPKPGSFRLGGFDVQISLRSTFGATGADFENFSLLMLI